MKLEIILKIKFNKNIYILYIIKKSILNIVTYSTKFKLCRNNKGLL